ncbi:MAG: ferredoxin--NADP reductase [Nitrososphaerales archaeon]
MALPPVTRVTVAKTVEEAPGIKSVYITYDKNVIKFQAGQSFTLYPGYPDEPNLSHPFSNASSPTEDFLLFTTRIREESAFKQRMNKLQAGDEVGILGPGPPKYVLPEETSKDIVFLGGGIGITPFRSMAKFSTDSNSGHRITLLYSSKTPQEIIYRTLWEDLEKTNTNLKVVHTITRAEDHAAWHGLTGRIDDNLIRENVENLNNTIFYICGPPALVRALNDLLSMMRINVYDIKIESFSGYVAQ